VRAVSAQDPTGSRAGISRAFAICVAQGQKRGEIAPGSLKATKAGKKASRRKAADKTHAIKMRDYEMRLAQARGEGRAPLEKLRALAEACRAGSSSKP